MLGPSRTEPSCLGSELMSTYSDEGLLDEDTDVKWATLTISDKSGPILKEALMGELEDLINRLLGLVLFENGRMKYLIETGFEFYRTPCGGARGPLV